MDKIISTITLSDYFRPTIKIIGIEGYHVEKDIKRIYNRILDVMADKTIDFFDNLRTKI